MTEPTVTNTLIEGLVSWLLTMAMRAIAPDLWDKLGGQKKKLIVVAITSIAVSLINSLAFGHLGWAAAGKQALASFLAAIGFRETTKYPMGELQMSRTLSLKTKL